MSPARILHSPADVGGHARQLSLAERELGLDSVVAVFAPQRFGYEADLDLRAGIDVPVPVRLARRARFLRETIHRYDVFHFNYGQTLLQVRQLGRVFDELALLRRLGKKIIVTYQGCDVRPYACCHCRKLGCAATTAYRAPGARRALRYAHRVFYLNPDLGRWLPGASFLPYANVDPQALKPQPHEPGEQVVVAHAPTDRAVKGTRHVLDAIDALRAEGLPVQLTLLEDLTHQEVRTRIASADVVVDQLLIGWYGGFAVEAMALAKPVVCFIREDENPFGERLPLVRATPTTLVDRLRELVSDAARRRRLGLACRAFVEAEHDPRQIARRVLDGLVEVPGAVNPAVERAR